MAGGLSRAGSLLEPVLHSGLETAQHCPRVTRHALPLRHVADVRYPRAWAQSPRYLDRGRTRRNRVCLRPPPPVRLRAPPQALLERDSRGGETRHGRSRAVTGGHGRSRAVTGGHGLSRAVTGGHGRSRAGPRAEVRLRRRHRAAAALTCMASLGGFGPRHRRIMVWMTVHAIVSIASRNPYKFICWRLRSMPSAGRCVFCPSSQKGPAGQAQVRDRGGRAATVPSIAGAAHAMCARHRQVTDADRQRVTRERTCR